MSVIAIYRQEETKAALACTVIEHLGGPKPYARVWDHKPGIVEWGWVLHESAVEVWREE